MISKRFSSISRNVLRKKSASCKVCRVLLKRDCDLEQLAQLRSRLNDYEEQQNERKKYLKFEIQLYEEADELEKMENIPDDEAERKGIELEEIGIGRKNRNEN